MFVINLLNNVSENLLLIIIKPLAWCLADLGDFRFLK